MDLLLGYLFQANFQQKLLQFPFQHKWTIDYPRKVKKM